MKILYNGFLSFALFSSSLAIAQEEAAPETEEESVEAPEKIDEKASVKVDFAALLGKWEKTSGESVRPIPRTWLFLQEASGSYGAPSPLSLDRSMFEAYTWFRLADSDAVKLFVQMNPNQKVDELKPGMLEARLKRYARLTNADGLIVKTAAAPSKWSLYVVKEGLEGPQFIFDKGPETLRQDLPAKWLAQQLGYDAIVVGTVDEYAILAKLRPLKAGAQGLVLRKSANALVGDAAKDVGALLRVMYETDDFAIAKVSLTKSGRSKIPMGGKVLFDQP